MRNKHDEQQRQQDRQTQAPDRRQADPVGPQGGRADRSVAEGSGGRRPGAAAAPEDAHEVSAQAVLARVRDDLAECGVEGAEAEALVREAIARLDAPAGDDDGGLGYTAWLDGIAIAHAARRESALRHDALRRELRQIERLMGGFASELSKLDEVLEVLAAYVRRMRTSTEADDPTLH